MVHRDLKPANIMLLSDHTTVDWVKVLDFGLVKPMGQFNGLVMRVIPSQFVHNLGHTQSGPLGQISTLEMFKSLPQT
jgi:serine/threonine protein kinase